MTTNAKKKVLFLCTGNYFRSRFAEALFNYLAEKDNLQWEAFSRGLAIHLVDGHLSPHTEKALHARKIEKRHTGETRVQASREDFNNADIVIALRDTEHRPMMRYLFPDLSENITYWEVRDIDESDPQASLAIVDELVTELIRSLKSHSAKSGHVRKAPH